MWVNSSFYEIKITRQIIQPISQFIQYNSFNQSTEKENSKVKAQK